MDSANQPVIAHISSSAQLDGGAEFCLVELVTEEALSGVAPIVILPHKGQLSTELDKRGIRYKVIRCFPWRHGIDEPGSRATLVYTIKKVLNLFAEIKLACYLKRNKCDLVHINTTGIGVGHLAASLLRLPMAWHLREYSDEAVGCTFYSEKDACAALSRAQLLIAVSESIATFFSEKYGLEDNVSVIYDKLPETSLTREEPPLAKEKISICLIANLTTAKGAIDALAALSSIYPAYRDKIELTLAGKQSDSEYVNMLHQFCRNHSLEGNVVFRDFVDNPYDLLSQADIALNCSRSESFGRTTVEGMLAGCLVIGNDNTCTHELLSNDHGLLYSGEADLAKKITWTIENRESARKIAQAGTKYARANFQGSQQQLIENLKILAQQTQ